MDHQARSAGASGVTSGRGPGEAPFSRGRARVAFTGTIQSSSMKQAGSAAAVSLRAAGGEVAGSVATVRQKSTPRSTDQPLRQGRMRVVATSVAFSLNMVPTLQAGILAQVVPPRD